TRTSSSPSTARTWSSRTRGVPGIQSRFPRSSSSSYSPASTPMPCPNPMRRRRAASAALALILAGACAHAGGKMDSTRTVTPADALQDIINDLPDGAALNLAEGRYDVNLRIEKSLTLHGQGNVVLDGHYRAPVLWVPKKNVQLTVENVTLRHG